MQILLFTFTMLMILASFCLRLFFTTSTDITLAKLNHTTFEMRKELYYEIHKARLSGYKQKVSSEKSKRPPYIPKRSLNTESGRFNLSLLFEKDPIKRAFCDKVLHHFYDKLFDNPNKLTDLLDEIHLVGLVKVQNGKKVKIEDLLDISKDNSNYFFEMIKGDKEKGIWPLQKVVVIQDMAERKVFCFHQADDAFLKLLLPLNAYEALTKLEKEKSANKEARVSIDEFKSLLQNQTLSDSEVDRILGYFQFFRGKNCHQIYAPKNNEVSVERISSLIQEDEEGENSSSS